VVDLIDAVEPGAEVVTPGQPGRLARIRPENWNWREWRPYAPLLLVAFAVGFGAWLLRAELRVVPYPNDATTLASMARLAERRIRAGHSPLDQWYAFEGLGSPQFLQYQALPHMLTGLLSVVFGASLFRFFNYFLICTWPVSVYYGARLLGLDRWQAAATALFSPMLVNVVGYGFEWGSFIWLGSGMWSMLWALWVMPIAIGLAWRAVAHGERYALTAFAVGLTCAFHFITGYFVLLSLGIFVLVNPPAVLKRVGRSAMIGLGSILVFAFVFFPTLANLKYVDQDKFQAGTFWVNSYGPGKVFSWLFHGKIFDYGRHPVVTVLVMIGAGVCLWRSWRSEEARVPLGLMALSLLLYSGRGTVGFVLDRLPGGADLLLHRFIIAVHYSGLLLAGIAAVWVFRLVVSGVRAVARVPARNWIAAGVACVLAGVALYPVLHERQRYADSNGSFISGQIAAQKTTGRAVDALLDIVKQRGDGRVYAGMSNNWGYYTKVNQVSLYEMPSQRDVDSIGFLLRTDSIGAEVEAYFNENDPTHYDLYNVKYLLLPPGRSPSVAGLATQIFQVEGYTLWEVPTSGYLEVVDATEPMDANRTDMGTVMPPYLNSAAVGEKRHPLVSFDGSSTPPPSLSATSPFSGDPGTVISSTTSLDNGRFAGRVTAVRPAWVMLKESYYPHWHAKVDGLPVRTAMLAPGFVGVPVPAGTHDVVFQYHSQSGYPLLFAIGVLTLLGLASGPALWRRYRHRPSEAKSEVGVKG
jgi:hypothetical protein